jgi:hypothetical protein
LRSVCEWACVPSDRSGAPLGKGGAVATFVSFINWPDQGVKNFRESGKRADAFAELVQSNGGSVKAIYWTFREYDLVAIHEATRCRDRHCAAPSGRLARKRAHHHA